MQTDEAVSQTGHKVLVVVARAQHQVAVDCQDPQGVQQGHLLSYSLVGSAELIEHRSVQTVVDRVEGKTLGAPLRLQGGRGGGGDTCSLQHNGQNQNKAAAVQQKDRFSLNSGH